MVDGIPGRLSLRPAHEADLPALFEIQLDETARHRAAFVDPSSLNRETYLAKHRQLLADPTITTRVVELAGEVIGSVAVFPMAGDTELTYWIRRDLWGHGLAAAAVASLLAELPTRPIHARAVEDNIGSIRVLERNGFVRVGSEDSFAAGRDTVVTEVIYRLDD